MAEDYARKTARDWAARAGLELTEWQLDLLADAVRHAYATGYGAAS